LGPGQSIHSAMLLGSYQYMLNHDFVSQQITELVFLAVDDFNRALDLINQSKITLLNE
jgi:hypothetical protein